MGLDHWYDARMAAVARFPFSADASRALAASLARVLRALVGPPKKCLVVDLDNTLWGGVLGEDGPAGIALGPSHPGSAFVDLQRAILGVHRRGVILAVASKNDHDEAMRVLGEHPHMVLRPEHFAALQIHWNEKVDSLAAIAADLDIGLDSLVFLDDSPVECARVRQMLPEVEVVQVPADPLALAGLVAGLEGFDTLGVSDEDLKRPSMYRAQTQRKELATRAGTIEEFYHSLGMTAVVGVAEPSVYGRLAQMTQRTNQFNMTTLRCSEADIVRMSESDDHLVLWVRVRDTFGDNGVVAMAWVEQSADTWTVANLLMSCRVIQRTVETVLLTEIVRRAAEAGVRRLKGPLRPTPKNEPARDFYARHGFQRVSGDAEADSLWEAEVASLPTSFPSWFDVEWAAVSDPAAPTMTNEVAPTDG